MYYKTKIQGYTLRNATIEDADIIIAFIKDLAEFEKMSNLVTVTQQDIISSIFEKKQACCLIGEENGNPVCLSIYFYNYSIFIGQANIHIEALFVSPAYRGKGYGKETIQCIAKIAVDTDCKRLDWACLKWNTPAIDFYKNLGAYPLDDRDTYRLEGGALKAVAKGMFQIPSILQNGCNQNS